MSNLAMFPVPATARQGQETVASDDLPAPPVPPTADLRHLTEMPINVTALVVSPMFTRLSGEGFRAAMALLCRGWHEVPAGSLPHDDQQLAAMAQCGVGPDAVKRFRDIRNEALCGWFECADGRLYHKGLAAKVNAVLAKDGEKSKRRSRASSKPSAARGNRTPAYDRTPPPETNDVEVIEPDDVPSAIERQFEIWWENYPPCRPGAKAPVRKKWMAIVKSGRATPEELIEGLERYNAAGYWGSSSAAGAERWLNAQYWTIEVHAPPVDLTNATRPPAAGNGIDLGRITRERAARSRSADIL